MNPARRFPASPSPDVRVARRIRPARLLFALFFGGSAAACAPHAAAPVVPLGSERQAERALADARQLVVVITGDWTATAGQLQRYERDTPASAWRKVGSPVAVVVGRTGLAWGVPFDSTPDAPVKHEGDGKAPAGVFPLDTAFAFAAQTSQLPFFLLRDESECVDDVRSIHYNTIVDRDRVPAVDWSSSEHMRRVAQYRYGVTVGYNAPHPVPGRGSCIFLHIWAGPGTSTAGCTAMDEVALRELMSWLDERRAPRLVQLPALQYTSLRTRWKLP